MTGPNDDALDGGALPGGLPPVPQDAPPATVIQVAPSNTVCVAPPVAPNSVVFTFIRAAYHRDWAAAFEAGNGLSMSDLLKGMSALDRLDLADLMAAQSTVQVGVNMPRMQYAAEVVNSQTVPAQAPGDLQSTGQVQDARNYVTNQPRLTIPSDLTGTLPDPNPAAPLATDADFQATATRLGVEVAAIRAVTDVESGRPFGRDGRPTLRYELHVFYAEVVGLLGIDQANTYKTTHPHLCQARWHDGDRYHVGGQPNEWSLLYGAMLLRPGVEAALRSASFGSFQIVGKYFAQTGAANVSAFVSNEFVSQGNQLSDFAGLVGARNLVGALRTRNWAQFALHYNGAGYRDNAYDTRLAAAYARRASAH